MARTVYVRLVICCVSARSVCGRSRIALSKNFALPPSESGGSRVCCSDKSRTSRECPRQFFPQQARSASDEGTRHWLSGLVIAQLSRSPQMLITPYTVNFPIQQFVHFWQLTTSLRCNT